MDGMRGAMKQAVDTAPVDSVAPAAPLAAARPPRWRRLLWPALALAGLALLFTLLPVQAWLQAGVDWVDDLGAWGPLALVLLYVLACVAMVPGSVLTLGAGAVFGVGLGALTVFIGATLGACAAFLVGRHLARDRVAARVAGNPRFAAIDRAVARQGLRIVLLTRLSPVFPFNLLNYAYGLTGVSFRHYLLGSVGMLPGTLLYVYLGSAGAQAASAAEHPAAAGSQVLFWLGLAATLAVTVVITRIARSALSASLDSATPSPSPESPVP